MLPPINGQEDLYMVSYGDSGFMEWAEENGFNDEDVRLMQRTAGKRALLWLLIPMAFEIGRAHV